MNKERIINKFNEIISISTRIKYGDMFIDFLDLDMKPDDDFFIWIIENSYYYIDKQLRENNRTIQYSLEFNKDQVFSIIGLKIDYLIQLEREIKNKYREYVYNNKYKEYNYPRKDIEFKEIYSKKFKFNYSTKKCEIINKMGSPSLDRERTNVSISKRNKYICSLLDIKLSTLVNNLLDECFDKIKINNCNVCKKDFLTTRYQKIYCSESCRNIIHNKAIKKSFTQPLSKQKGYKNILNKKIKYLDKLK